MRRPGKLSRIGTIGRIEDTSCRLGNAVLASPGISYEVEIEFKISKGIRSEESHAQKMCITDVVVFVVCYMHLLNVEVLLFNSSHGDTSPGRNYFSRMTIMLEAS